MARRRIVKPFVGASLAHNIAPVQIIWINPRRLWLWSNDRFTREGRVSARLAGCRASRRRSLHRTDGGRSAWAVGTGLRAPKPTLTAVGPNRRVGWFADLRPPPLVQKNLSPKFSGVYGFHPEARLRRRVRRSGSPASAPPSSKRLEGSGNTAGITSVKVSSLALTPQLHT